MICKYLLYTITLYMALTPDCCLLQAERLLAAAEAGGDPGHGPGLRADLHHSGPGGGGGLQRGRGC